MAFAKWFSIFGLICLILAVFFFWQRNNPQRLAFALNDLPDRSDIINSLPLPTEIIIKDINLDLPIIPSKLEKGEWEATTKGVSWLSSSPLPGTKGNSILYGHNWPNLLGNILKLKPGQVIRIKFADGSTKLFVIDSTTSVSPKEVSVLAPSKTPRVTLYTCSGFLDSQRFVIGAKY